MLSVSDRVTVLRKGETIGSVKTSEATVEMLTEMMVGKKIELNINRTDPVDPSPRLVVEGLTCINRDGVKVLGSGQLTKKLNVRLDAYSASAKARIEELGGTVQEA